MKNKRFLIFIPIVILLTFSCSTSDIDGFNKNENGLYFRFHEPKSKSEKHPKPGDGVYMKFLIKIKSTDSILTDSRIVPPDNGMDYYMIPPSTFKGSLDEALCMMAVGDSASFIVNADSFFVHTTKKKQLPRFMKPNDKLVAEIKMLKIVDANRMETILKKRQEEQVKMYQQMEFQSRTDLEKYIVDNKIKEKPTASGLYYIELKKGSGFTINKTDNVSVYYKGTFLDGTVFDENTNDPQPISFNLQQVIPAWTEGVALMKAGGKAKLICPYQIAYGARGVPGIPPFSNLVFEIELKSSTPGTALKPEGLGE